MTDERIIVTTSSKVVELLKKQGSKIEMAPPKSWRPFCFKFPELVDTEDGYEDHCRTCPFVEHCFPFRNKENLKYEKEDR